MNAGYKWKKAATSRMPDAHAWQGELYFPLFTAFCYDMQLIHVHMQVGTGLQSCGSSLLCSRLLDPGQHSWAGSDWTSMFMGETSPEKGMTAILGLVAKQKTDTNEIQLVSWRAETVVKFEEFQSHRVTNCCRCSRNGQSSCRTHGTGMVRSQLCPKGGSPQASKSFRMKKRSCRHYKR